MNNRRRHHARYPGELGASFAGVNQSLQQVFGKRVLPADEELDSRLYKFIRTHKLLTPLPYVWPSSRKALKRAVSERDADWPERELFPQEKPTRERARYHAFYPGELGASFAGIDQSLEQVFGKAALPIDEINRRLHRFMQAHHLFKPVPFLLPQKARRTSRKAKANRSRQRLRTR